MLSTSGEPSRSLELRERRARGSGERRGYDPTIARSRRSPPPSGSVPERAKRITRADDRAVGSWVWQHARAEALALAEGGRQVEVGHRLAVAARREIQRADQIGRASC